MPSWWGRRISRISSRGCATTAWMWRTAGAPAPDLLLEDHWSFLRVRPVSEAGRRWVTGRLMRARRRFGRVVVTDPRAGVVMVEPRFFRAVVGAAESGGLVVRVVGFA